MAPARDEALEMSDGSMFEEEAPLLARSRTLAWIGNELTRIRHSLSARSEDTEMYVLALELADHVDRLMQRERELIKADERLTKERTHLHSDFDRKVVRPILDQLEGRRRRCVALEKLLEAKVSQAGEPSRGKRR